MKNHPKINQRSIGSIDTLFRVGLKCRGKKTRNQIAFELGMTTAHVNACISKIKSFGIEVKEVK